MNKFFNLAVYCGITAQVSQAVTEESKIIFDTVESLIQLAELRDDVTGKHVDRIGLLQLLMCLMLYYLSGHIKMPFR
jgi:response regulator RpfG family c-di-GMP phosphodiesterase